MNKEQIAGQWQQLKGKIKERWGKLTDDDVALYNGKREQFFGKVKEQYGVAKEEAEETIREWSENAEDDATAGGRQDAQLRSQAGRQQPPRDPSFPGRLPGQDEPEIAGQPRRRTGSTT
jgi:uncharacterized protein YjbJ (UPF0337 family)